MPTVFFLGNFEPPNSTENDVSKTLTAMGHTVVQLQEQLPGSWRTLSDALAVDPEPGPQIDLILWTSTRGLAAQIPHNIQRRMQYDARVAGVPVVGFHLDRWWGLDREDDVLTEPWFRCDSLFTADGGHDRAWVDAGINHHWSPPAISPFNCVRGSVRREFTSEVAFVGNWQGGYHEEWQHRPHLITHLRRRYGNKLALWPQRGQDAVRGEDLADLYASTKVVVGDSALVPKADGSPMTHYCSDRVFETLGRGGVLIHPNVVGVTDGSLVTAGTHLLTWDLEDWAGLDTQIDRALSDQPLRQALRTAGFQHVKANHTYTNRLTALLAMVGGS